MGIIYLRGVRTADEGCVTSVMVIVRMAVCVMRRMIGIRDENLTETAPPDNEYTFTH